MTKKIDTEKLKELMPDTTMDEMFDTFKNEKTEKETEITEIRKGYQSISVTISKSMDYGKFKTSHTITANIGNNDHRKVFDIIWHDIKDEINTRWNKE